MSAPGTDTAELPSVRSVPPVAVLVPDPARRVPSPARPTRREARRLARRRRQLLAVCGLVVLAAFLFATVIVLGMVR